MENNQNAISCKVVLIGEAGKYINQIWLKIFISFNQI